MESWFFPNHFQCYLHWIFHQLSLKCDQPYFMYIHLIFISETRFLFLDFKLYFNLFPNSLKYWKLEFANVALVGLYNFLLLFIIGYESDGILGFLIFSLGRTSRFLPITKAEKLIFLSSTYFHNLSDCKDNLLSLVFVWEY